MKLSIAVASKYAKQSAFVVWRGFEESIKKAAVFGYHGVELALKTADEVDPEKLAKWLEDSNIEVSCISTGQVYSDLGLYFTHPDSQVRHRALEVFKDLIYLAKDFGKSINIGRVRGFIDEEEDRLVYEKLFINTIKQICDFAGPFGISILIEPVNRYEINFINNLDEGSAVLKQVNVNNIKLMPDLFHMNIEEDTFVGSFKRNSNLIKYIHFADSNRLAPGWGHLNFDSIFNTLKKINYDGWISVEILPIPEPDKAAKQAAEYLLPKIAYFNQI